MKGCVLFQFGSNLGKYRGNFELKKHKNWPDLYKACNIADKCETNNFLTIAHQNDKNNEEESILNVDKILILTKNNTNNKQLKNNFTEQKNESNATLILMNEKSNSNKTLKNGNIEIEI